MNTCETCQYKSQHRDTCYTPDGGFREVLPPENTCSEYETHYLVRLGAEKEQARCAGVCAAIAAGFHHNVQEAMSCGNRSATREYLARCTTALKCERMIRGDL